ncbi:MAG: hypothetical protein ACOCSE_06005, partial [Chitinivibrionales bacterium]
MNILNVLTKVFGSKQDKDLKKLRPIVKKVNEEFDKITGLSDEDLQAKTQEFRERLDSGETLDDLVPEAFAVVKSATHRVLGNGKYVTDERACSNRECGYIHPKSETIPEDGKCPECGSSIGRELPFMAHFDVQIMAAEVLH